MRGCARRRKNDGVNNRGVTVRREIVWLPKTNTDPKMVLENGKRSPFSGLLTQGEKFRR